MNITTKTIEKEFENSENSCREIFKNHLSNLYKNISYIEKLDKGLSNSLYKITIHPKDDIDKDFCILLKIFGTSSDILVDRETELKVMQIIEKESILLKFQNGIVYKFINGETLFLQDLQNEEFIKKISRKMYSWHQINTSHLVENFDIFEKIKSWIHILSSKKTVKDLEKIQELMEQLQEKILESCQETDKVFCHNDLNSNNIINDNNGEIHFIDFEFSSKTYYQYDIANHFCEFGGLEITKDTFPEKEIRFFWYKQYFSNEKSRKIHENFLETLDNQVLLLSAVSHLFWALWSFIKSLDTCEKSDFCYYFYAKQRLQCFFDAFER